MLVFHPAVDPVIRLIVKLFRIMLLIISSPGALAIAIANIRTGVLHTALIATTHAHAIFRKTGTRRPARRD
ncbi:MULTISPECIES: hypothetical protein [Micromonospora]|uniref:hypothetical protein n=1 Tax=Micromonospora TaxID=1873 RepID=UPI000B89A610|nr:hypothetical protein [Micromonospora yangpuensis]GGL87854.1 hypothetical protein GCM10012279_01890 [Micromonospora yangpuensis]